MKSKCIATEVNGHSAVASVAFGTLLARVEVVSNGRTAVTTCLPNHWRIKVAELVSRLHNEYDCTRRISKSWNLL